MDELQLPEPAGFRTRYRSEPGMLGHYPWTYADQRRRRVDRPGHETEDLYTAEQVRARLAAERDKYTTLLHAYHRACVDAANRAEEIGRLQQAWENTRTQRDELLAHIAGKAPLPHWAADWLKA